MSAKGIYEEIAEHVVAESMLGLIADNLPAFVTRMRELGIPWEAIEEFGLSLSPDATPDEVAWYLETLTEPQARETDKEGV